MIYLLENCDGCFCPVVMDTAGWRISFFLEEMGSATAYDF